MVSPRRLLALLLLLTAVAVPVVAPAPPALADASCQDETITTDGPVDFGCDDTTPPVATVTASPPVADGVIASTQVTFSFTAAYDPVTGDSGPIDLQCSFDGSSWTACDSGSVTESGLTDPTVGHTFSVRAIDHNDQAINACADPVVGCLTGTETEDVDYNDTTIAFKADPGVSGGGGADGGGGSGDGGGGGGADADSPQTTITRGVMDSITPDDPVALSKKITLRVASTQAGHFNCALNAHAVRCGNGTAVLRSLVPGPQVFVAQAVDHQRLFDATPATLDFFVPTNIAPGQGWTRATGHGHFDGDYVATRSKGATIGIGSFKRVHELRLIAPAGPGLGVVEVRVGNGAWTKVDLHAPKAQAVHSYEVFGPQDRTHSGAIQIRAAKVPSGGSVALDAIVVR